MSYADMEEVFCIQTLSQLRKC